uniref:Integrase catalytic domain-containing protein n=1 Tax=Chenopodium quinoa TaxID=63459 RepID=A0A803N1T5_CHEQI
MENKMPILKPSQDPSSPYHLHPSDNLGMKLVSDKFDGNGYGDWNSAREIWQNLEERYEASSGTVLFALEQAITEIKQDNVDPLPYYHCANCTCTIAQRLVKSQQDKRLVQFLMKLNDGFEVVRGNILLIQPLPVLLHAYRLITQEEKHKQLFKGSKAGSMYISDEAVALAVTKGRCFKLNGYYPDHKFDKNKRVAAYVQKDRHNFSTDDSGNLVIPSGFAQRFLDHMAQQKLINDHTGEASAKSANVVGKACLLSNKFSNWIIHGGASHHIYHDKDAFISWYEFTEADKHIAIPDGRKASSMKTRVLGKLKNGLYYLEESLINSQNKVLAVVVPSSQQESHTKLWQLRMGHFPISQLGMTWVFFMKYKSDVVTVFSNFVTYIKNQFSFTVKNVRSDNTQELCEGEMKSFLVQRGIQHQRSCPDTSQQNGDVERKHRHLLETSRALYFQSKLPNSFWNDYRDQIGQGSHLLGWRGTTVMQFPITGAI